MTPIYLEDLLAEKSFSVAANHLSRHIRDAHDFPPLYQVGALVPSVESAALALEECGMGPFFIMTGPAARWREKGERRAARGRGRPDDQAAHPGHRSRCHHATRL